MDKIPHTEIVFNPHSMRDQEGRVFRWRGQIYRAISAAIAPMFKRLFRDGTIQRLVDLGLIVETELTAYSLDGYELVVHHRPIPFVSYPTEWCAGMLKDAALHTLDLVWELAACGLTLKDSHPWNILFDGNKPLRSYIQI